MGLRGAFGPTAPADNGGRIAELATCAHADVDVVAVRTDDAGGDRMMQAKIRRIDMDRSFAAKRSFRAPRRGWHRSAAIPSSSIANLSLSSRSRSLGATGSDLIAFEHSFDFCDRTLRIVLVDFRDEAASRFGTKVPAHDAECAWRGNQDTGHIIL